MSTSGIIYSTSLFDEPQTYAQAVSVTVPPPVVQGQRMMAFWQSGTASPRALSGGYPSYVHRQMSKSTPNIPLRSYSTLSNQTVAFCNKRASLAHEDAVPAGSDSSTVVEEDEDGGFNCVAITPEHIVKKKYRRYYFIPKKYDGKVPTVSALKTDFSPVSIECPTKGGFQWKICEAPEGNIYFRDDNKKIVTFVDLFNESYRDCVCGCASMLLRRISLQSDKMPQDIEITIMLEDYKDDEGYAYGYYIASWQKRCLFWLDVVDHELITRGSRVCLTESHIEPGATVLVGGRILHLFGLSLRRTCQDTCGNVPVSPYYFKQRNQATQKIIQHQITSDNSLFPYDKTEATDILKCLNRVEALEEDQDANDVWIIARCKQNLEEYRFLNYHGERGARIHRLDSVQKTTIRGGRSILFWIFTPLLFFMPSVYIRELECLWIDDTVDWISWRKFVSVLDKDWNQSMTPATVILSANIGFLAIGSIDNHDDSPHRSAAQIASYISSVLSFFFFVTVQILSQQHRTSHYYTATKACAFLERRAEHWLGLESVAITYSLPTSLFIWSMLTLLAALMIAFFWGTDAVTRAIMGVAVAILLGATAILLWLDWNHHTRYRTEDELELEPPHRPILRMFCHLRGVKGIASIVRNQWHEKGDSGFGSCRMRNGSTSTRSIASQV